jgi:hypothetical protein
MKRRISVGSEGKSGNVPFVSMAITGVEAPTLGHWKWRRREDNIVESFSFQGILVSWYKLQHTKRTLLSSWTLNLVNLLVSMQKQGRSYNKSNKQVDYVELHGPCRGVVA